MRVASVLEISYQTYDSVKTQAKVSGWGFVGSASFLSQGSQLQNQYIVGVDLDYSEIDLPFPPRFNAASVSEAEKLKIKRSVIQQMNIGVVNQLKGPAMLRQDVDIP